MASLQRLLSPSRAPRFQLPSPRTSPACQPSAVSDPPTPHRWQILSSSVHAGLSLPLLGPCCLSECPPHRSPGLCFALSKVVLLRKVWKLLFRNVPLPPIAVDSSLEFYAMHTGPLQHPGPVFPPCFLLLFCCIHCSGCVVRLLVSMLACVLCFCTSLT